MEIDREHRSPNFKGRTQKPTLVVLHATAGKTDAGDLSWIVSLKSGISYHYLVGRDGTVYELVDPTKTAFHAGESTWGGRAFCNTYSIGVAWSNRHDNTESLTAKQIARMRDLLTWLKQRHPTLAEVATHADVSPGRKSDPEKIPNFHRADWCGPLD